MAEAIITIAKIIFTNWLPFLMAVWAPKYPPKSIPQNKAIPTG
jgi:hypothetical protein